MCPQCEQPDLRKQVSTFAAHASPAAAWRPAPRPVAPAAIRAAPAVAGCTDRSHALFHLRRRSPVVVADTLDHMAGLCRALGRAPEAAHWAHLSTAIRRVLDHQPRTPWSLVAPVARRAGAARPCVTPNCSSDCAAPTTTRSPTCSGDCRPARERLIRHGQHPLRHRVADEDVLLDADLERHLPTRLVDMLLPDSPEDALVPLGRAWMQAKQARKELDAAAGHARRLAHGGRPAPHRSGQPRRRAARRHRRAQRPGADGPPTPCRATCWWSPVHAPSLSPPTPSRSSSTPSRPSAVPTSLVVVHRPAVRTCAP